MLLLDLSFKDFSHIFVTSGIGETRFRAKTCDLAPVTCALTSDLHPQVLPSDLTERLFGRGSSLRLSYSEQVRQTQERAAGFHRPEGAYCSSLNSCHCVLRPGYLLDFQENRGSAL